MPQKKTLIELFPCLKQFAILIRPFAICSGESWYKHCTKMKFSSKDFFSKCDQTCKELRVDHIY